MAVVVFDNGNATDIWSDVLNWVGGALPLAADTADIDANCTLDMNDIIAILDVGAGLTLTMQAGNNITGMTGTCLGTGTVYMGAGCQFLWDVNSNTVSPGSLTITGRGTSGSICLIDNVHATGGVDHNLSGTSYDLEWTDLHSVYRLYPVASIFRFVDCDIEGKSQYFRFRGTFDVLVIKNTYISGFAMALDGPWYAPGARLQLENITFGVDRDGNVQANTMDFIPRAQMGLCYMRNVRFTAATQINTTVLEDEDRIIVDNYGFANDVGTRGIWYTDTLYYTLTRSTTNPYAGEAYCALVTPKAGCDAEGKYPELHLYIPIQTGDNIEVTTHGRRNGLSDDCAILVIDEEEAWFTSASHAPTLTNNNTYYEFTQTASGAAGTAEKGAVRIILRVLEAPVGADTFQWGGVTVTCGGVDYVVSMQQGSEGMPIADEPAAGGGMLQANKRGNKQ